VLGNHDNPRPRTRFGGREARARSAAVVLLTLRGVPFLYAGDELGLEDAEVPADRVVDPGGRDGCRAPLPWVPDERHGWAGEPWLPFGPDAAARSVAAQRDEPSSVLHLHRRLLTHRRACPALVRGDQRLLDVHPDVLAFHRALDDEERLVVCNLGDDELEVTLPAPADHPGARWTVVVASDGAGEGEVFPGRLAADRAVVLAPRDR
jgi:alpha-glucosidase